MVMMMTFSNKLLFEILFQSFNLVILFLAKSIDLFVDDMPVKLISWYDVQNIDLNDIDCPPYYKARDGNLYNFVTAALVNAGMERGKTQ